MEPSSLHTYSSLSSLWVSFCPLSFGASENDLLSLIVHDDGGAWIFKLTEMFSFLSSSIGFFFFVFVGRRDDAFYRFLPSFVVGAISSDLSGRRGWTITSQSSNDPQSLVIDVWLGSRLGGLWTYGVGWNLCSVWCVDFVSNLKNDGDCVILLPVPPLRFEIRALFF